MQYHEEIIRIKLNFQQCQLLDVLRIILISEPAHMRGVRSAL